MKPRYELCQGKFGIYFHDTHYGGFDMPLEIVLQKLNRLDECKERLRKYNDGKPDDQRI